MRRNRHDSGMSGRWWSNYIVCKPLQRGDDLIALLCPPVSLLLDHEDKNAACRRIDSHGIFICAAMVETVLRYVPGESIICSAQAHVLRDGHRMEGLSRNDPLAVQFASIQNHAAEFRYVFRSGEEAAGGHWVAMLPVVERIG